MSQDCSKRGKSCPELRVSKRLSSSSYLLLLCPAMSPRCCRGKEEAIPCYQELQNILRKNWRRISKWAQDESKTILGLKACLLCFVKLFCFAKLTRWLKKGKKKKKKERKFRSEDKNKLNKFNRAKAALKKIHNCQEPSALLVCCTWTKKPKLQPGMSKATQEQGPFIPPCSSLGRNPWGTRYQLLMTSFLAHRPYNETGGGWGYHAVAIIKFKGIIIIIS